ncbi:MAG: OAR protein, partial [Hyphomonadaceae bacterium]
AQNFEMPSDWKGNLSFKLDAPSGWRFGVDIVASQSNEAVAFRDIRARPLTVNGVQQYTPDGRIRYDGLVISGASAAAIRSNRITAGLPTSAEDDLLNLGNSRDIQAYNPGETSWSRTLALSASKTFESINFDLSAALILQDASNFGTITEFATTDSGFYGDQFSAYDPNTSVKGRASNEIENQFKLSGTWTQNFFGELASRFTLFAESRAGRPFSFVMTDAAGSSRGPVFGVNRGDQLLYVPNVDAPDAGNPLKFVSPQGATVFFADAATLANFTSIVREWGLPANQITPKGYGDNPRINQVDFQFDQELPGFLSGHRTHLTFDVKNLLNLVNDNWGLVREYGDSRGGTGNRVVSVQCADASGTALDASNALSCPAYRYSSFNSGAGAVGSNAPNIDTSSRWYVQVGLKYQF